MTNSSALLVRLLNFTFLELYFTISFIWNFRKGPYYRATSITLFKNDRNPKLIARFLISINVEVKVVKKLDTALTLLIFEQ